uniref:Ubl4 C-terminal TUGS domain-containing protein n=1 Tax=Timema bartmani TaxID=61472 RepID=A0A7R9EZU2_9NEOP|nr:unnamed protein product [Timema bartmani]
MTCGAAPYPARVGRAYLSLAPTSRLFFQPRNTENHQYLRSPPPLLFHMFTHTPTTGVTAQLTKINAGVPRFLLREKQTTSLPVRVVTYWGGSMLHPTRVPSHCGNMSLQFSNKEGGGDGLDLVPTYFTSNACDSVAAVLDVTEREKNSWNICPYLNDLSPIGYSSSKSMNVSLCLLRSITRGGLLVIWYRARDFLGPGSKSQIHKFEKKNVEDKKTSRVEQAIEQSPQNGALVLIQIQSYNSIRDVKQKVFDALHIPIEHQKLLLIGKPLAGHVLAFAWRKSGKARRSLSKPNRDLNFDLPVIGSLAYYESSALDHAATEADDKKISDYPIKEGSRLHLIVKKEDSSSKSTKLGRTMFSFLNQYYSEADSKRILDEFMKNFEVSISNLSLDDLERIATSYLKEEKKND